MLPELPFKTTVDKCRADRGRNTSYYRYRVILCVTAASSHCPSWSQTTTKSSIDSGCFYCTLVSSPIRRPVREGNRDGSLGSSEIDTCSPRGRPLGDETRNRRG